MAYRAMTNNAIVTIILIQVRLVFQAIVLRFVHALDWHGLAGPISLLVWPYFLLGTS